MRAERHVRRCRGLLLNGILSLDPGYELLVDRRIDYRMSVWKLHGELVIPFSAGHGTLVLIVPGKSDAVHEPQCCVHRASATYLIKPLAVAEELEHVGWLPYAVAGLKAAEPGGPTLLQVMASAPGDEFGLQYSLPGKMELIEIGDAFRDALLRPFASDPRARSPLRLGTVPGQWGWFPAWRWAHLMSGDREARRVSLYFRPMRESPSGANLRHAPGGNPLFVIAP